MTETTDGYRSAGGHVAPVAGGHLRASDADRDQVSTVLSTAFAEGRLSREEYDERVDALLRAKTFDDLVGLTRDLVVVAGPASAAGSRSYAVDTRPGGADVDRMIGIFGGAERKGRWRVKRELQTYALFGGFDLDMREAVFESPEVVINGFWIFGGLDLKVPEGVEVRNETVGIFGGTDVKDVADPQPGAPVVVLKGLALFGGVSVKGSARKDRSRALRRRRWSHGCGGPH